jgi:sulfatase maturation enzyme AslB (radical SAM superfamily)
MVMKQSEQFVCSKLFRDLIVKFPSEGIKNCCKTQDINNIPVADIDQNYFTKNERLLADQKTMLFDNKLPDPTCETCIHAEPHSLFRSWNQFGWLADDDKNQLYAADNFRTFEFMLSSACDLKCVYCAPKDSSAWAKELGEPVQSPSPEWKAHVKKALLEYFENKNWDTQHMHWFYFSGGEPTYNLETMGFIEDVLDRVPSTVKKTVILNSNLNTKPIVLERFLQYVKNNPHTKIGVSASLDSIEQKCEAIRYGINWERAMSNLKRYFEFDNVQVFLSPTVNLLSVPDMLEYIVYFKELYDSYNKPLWFNQNMVAEPWLSPTSMLAEHNTMLDDAIAYCEQHSIAYVSHLKHIKQLIGTDNTPDTRDHVKKHLEYLELKRPDTKWRELFPHTEDIINGQIQ